MFGVLGHLEVSGTGGPLSVGGPVPRRILTALLARPGEVVSLDRLVLAAWGDDPPPSAERTLQSHLTRLREALQQLDGEAAPSLERQAGGFRLLVAADDVDAVRFERLVAEADDASPVEAVRLLREALGLWRPPVPYADLLDTAYPAAEAARLGELHGGAGEAVVEALLDGGSPAAASAEAESCLAGEPYRERLWELLMLALYRQGRQGDALAAYQRARRELDEGLGVEPGPALRQLENQVLAQDPALLVAGRSVRTPCPYKGLARYDAGDAALFVGRERLVEDLVARLVDGALLVVVGPSGAGKSSLVRAGLVPALAEGALPGSASWYVPVLVPGSDPLVALAEATTGDEPVRVLVVDQAEEALLAGDGSFVGRFGDAVLGLVDAGARVVLALRADFYGRLADHPGLARRVGPATVLIAPPDDDELRRIVVEPAARVGLQVEPGLVDLIVAEVRGRPGALPVLSTALVRTWEHREQGTLTVNAYRAGGGVEGALQRVGEEAWAALATDGQRAACRRLLLRLATDEDGRWVRRRARRSEVAPSDEPDAIAALMLLAARRLVVVRADDVEIAHEALLSGWPRLAGWLDDARTDADVLERLAAAAASWSSSGQDTTELYRGTRLQAALDTAAARPDDLTATENRFLAESQQHAERELTEQRRRARRNRAVAVGLAVALVLAGVVGGFAVHQQRVAADNARAARAAALHADATRLGAQARASGRRYDLSLLLAAQAYRLQPSAQTESDLLGALEQGDAVRAVIPIEDEPLALAESPDGHTIAYENACGGVATWSTDQLAAGPKDVQNGSDGCGPRSIAFAPDGTLVVGMNNVVAPLAQAVYTDPGAEPGNITRGAWALSPDGQRVLALTNGGPSGGYGEHAVTWSLADPQATRSVPLGAEGVWAGTCGSYACVTTADQRLLRFNFATGKLISSVRIVGAAHSPLIDGDVVFRFVSSPHGTLVAIPYADHLVKLVHPATGAVARTLAGSGTDAAPLAFSRDGELLAGRDGATVLVWDLHGSPLPERYVGHAGRVLAATFSPDGSTLITSGEDHAMIVWDLSGRARFGRVLTRELAPPGGPIVTTMWAAGTRIAVGEQDGTLLFVDPRSGAITRAPVKEASPNGVGYPTIRSGIGSDLAVAATGDGFTTVWSMSTGRRLHVVQGLPEKADGYAPDTWVTRDGLWAATWRTAASVQIIDVAAGRVVRTLPVPVDPFDSGYHAVYGWTRDGAGVLVVRQNWGDTIDAAGELLVLDAQTGHVVMRKFLDHWPDEAVDAGSYIALGSEDGALTFLDPKSGRTVAPEASMNGLSLANVGTSPDGRWLSVSGAPPFATLWDAATKAMLGDPLPIDPESRDSRARFTADGELAVVTMPTLRIFPTDPAVWLARACREAGRSLTKDEWATYLPGRPYAPACTGS